MKKIIVSFCIGISAFAFATYADGAPVVPMKFVAKSGHDYHIQFNSTLSRFWGDMFVVTTNSGTVNLSLPCTNGPVGFYRIFDTTGPIFWYGWWWYAQSNTLSLWGMGTNQITYVHNDRPYEWYVDQSLTGPDSEDNCGPSSTAMACEWWNSTNAGIATAIDARNTYPEGGGWWYTTDVYNYLTLKGVQHSYNFVTLQAMTNALNNGQILILCINISYIPMATNSQMRVHEFAYGGTGHFIVVKGYRITDSTLWFECYDPNDNRRIYTDGTPIGRDRHYGWGELDAAITNWWSWFISISPPSSVKSNVKSMNANALSSSSVPTAWGK